VPHDGRAVANDVIPERRRTSAGWRSCAAPVVVVTLALAAAACHRARPPRVLPAPPPVTPSSGALHVLVGDSVRTLPLEEYVAGCVVAELGAPRVDLAAARRARQVQAILCRSYATTSRNRHASDGYDVCATTHCQVYRPAPATETGRLARAAAADTKGMILVFDGRPVRPLYHAACGGRTSAARDVWPGNGESWLVSVADEGCQRETAWTFQVELDRLGGALGTDERFGPALPLREVTVAARDGAGRASTVRLGGRSTVVVRGDEFRAAVTRAFGLRSLQSTLFTVHRLGNRLSFEGRGAGHGVGLCQAGAIRLASRGQSPEAILRHYFPGTALAHLE
jgi:stage II sporulation protein D